MKTIILLVAIILIGFGFGKEASAGWAAGKAGEAMDFDGTRDYVSVGNVYNGVRTVEFWVKADNTTKKIMDLNNTVYVQVVDRTITATGWTSPTIYVNGVKNSTTISTSTWAHVVISTETGINATSTKFGTFGTSYSDYFDGTLDEIKFYNRVLSGAEVRYHYNRGGPVAEWRFDEGSGSTAYDSTENNNDGHLYLAPSGNTATSSAWVSGRHGSALSLDGVDDYVNVGNGASLQLSNKLTIEAWVKLDRWDIGASTPRPIGWLVNKGISTTYSYIFTAVGDDNQPKVRLSLYDGSWHAQNGNTLLTTGIWYHLAATYDGAAGTMDVYLNGVKDAATKTTNVPASLPYYNLNDVLIGKSQDNDYIHDGLIDDVRIYNYARTPDEIRLDYNAGFAARFGPLSSCDDDPGACMTEGLVGYWDMEEGRGTVLHDGSGNNNNATTTNMTTPWTGGIVPGSGGKKGGSALSFDGTNDYVDAGNDSSLKNITTAVTVEGWFKAVSFASWATGINKMTTPSDRDSFRLCFSPVGGVDMQPYFDLAAAQGGDGANADGVLSYGTWYHLVGTWDKTSGVAKIYVNGVLQSDTGFYVGDLDATDVDLSIGGFTDTGYPFNGLIDEVRVYNRALSAAEVRYHYNRGGPVAQWKFDEGSGSTAYDSTENNNDGTISGASWVTGKYGPALSFDGVDDYVDAGSSSVYQSSQGTAEFWYNPDTGAVGEMVGYSVNINFRMSFTYDSRGPGVVLRPAGGTYSEMYLSQLTPGWHHYAFVQDGVDGEMYIDGVFIGKIGGTQSGAWTNAFVGNWYIGRMGGAEPIYFEGRIDEVRIYNYARSPSQIQQDYNAGLAAHFGPKTDCDSDPGACMTEGLVGYWDMEEGTGTTIHDRSGNNNNGTTTNMTTPWTGGIVSLSGGKKGGSALSFDGTDDDVTTPTNSFSAKGTITMWINTRDGTLGQYLISAGSPFYFVINNTGANKLEAWPGGELLSASQAWVNNTWYHVSYVFDNSISYAALYVNSNKVVENTSQAVSSEIGTAAHIGSYIGSSNWFSGLIDDVRIYNRALSDAEIRYHYNRGGPVAHWKMNEGEGSTAYDATENNNDGTISGATWASGKYGSALSFDGVNDYVNAGNGTSLQVANTITAEFWVYQTGRSGDNVIASKGVRSWHAGWEISDQNGDVRVSLGTGAEGQEQNWLTGYAAPLNQWLHLVFTADTNTDILNFYVNGSLYGATTITVSADLSGSADNLYIGVTDSLGGFWDGLVDDVRIYNYVRNAEQIRQDYNAGLSTHFR